MKKNEKKSEKCWSSEGGKKEKKREKESVGVFEELVTKKN
jgi:hypothetical protein